MSKCFLCEKKAKGDLARPDSCAKHWFHQGCLTNYALRQSKCPIDMKEFKQIVTQDGRKIDVSRRKDSSSSSDSDGGLGQKLAALALLGAIANANTESFKCDLCDESTDGERAKTGSCGHEFHRSCLIMHSKKDNLCPKKNCKAEYDKIVCQNGDVLGIKNSNAQQLLAALAAGGSFRCRLCSQDDATRERAKAKPCGHEFHRGCLIERARTNNNCPICNSTIREINCMFGPDLTVGDSDGQKVACRQS